MPFLIAETEGDQARVHWLIRLRWVAVLGVLGVVIVAGPVLGLIARTLPLFVIVGVLTLWNLVLAWREHRNLPSQAAGTQVSCDLVLLGALLCFSGGLRNPFSIFLVVQIILGAILLPRGTALRLAAIGSILCLLLATLESLSVLPGGEFASPAGPGDPAVWGIALALIITIGVSLNFTVTIMEDLRARAREATLYHQQVERERHKVFEVVRSVGAAMVLLDRDLRLDWQNPRSELVLGRLPPGQPFRLPGDASWPDPAILRKREVLEREWRGQDCSGRLRTYHLSASPVHGAGGELDQVILAFTDITEQRAVEEQLHRTEKLAALGRLAAGLAHEINTPLASVRILGTEGQELLPRALAGDAEAREELGDHLQDIGQEVDRISFLVRRFLDLSHPGSDRAIPCDLKGVVEEATHLISMRSPGSRHRIHLEVLEDQPQVVTSPGRLRQVLLNVLDNALDATRSNGGRVVVRTRWLEGRPTIEVDDQGEGIVEENLARVFEPFFTTKEVGEGTGLGLYVSYEIMKNLGGDISVESRPGHGTMVRLVLPAGGRQDCGIPPS